MAFVGSARKRSLFRLQVYERVEISLVKVYQRVGKCAIRLKDEFYSFIKSEIRDTNMSRALFLKLQTSEINVKKLLG